ncbi:SDR family NAD(P)-dependent oxidoreductase [Nocardia sp. NPDC059246]|uniref:SDR family NAD(P)-dependent oxidoreductase n=1 Tax=unclassified Nocardia TaxID=2637762 RepID=UPI0036C8455B
MSRGLRLAGAKVLLTGATGGLGQAIARTLATQGAELCLTGRRTDVLDHLSAELGATAYAADLSRPDEVTRLMYEVGPIDVLIAGAGVPAGGRVGQFDDEALDEAIAVNLRAPMTMARAAAKVMQGQGKRGHIVFVGSIGGRVSSGDTAVYNATKFGLRGFALGLRDDLRTSGIGVSLVEPGFVHGAGMFADSGVRLPPGFRTTSLRRVTDAVVDAIECDVAVLTVAPVELRIGVWLGSIAPELSSRIQRLTGMTLARSTPDPSAGQQSSAPLSR